MEISLVTKNGVPASMSTSKSFTTNASRWSLFALRLKSKRTSPTTTNGVIPSAWNAVCLVFWIGAPICSATAVFIMLVSAPVSRVRFIA